MNLVYVGHNSEGEPEYMGESRDWTEAEQLAEKASPDCLGCEGRGIRPEQIGKDEYKTVRCDCTYQLID